MSTFFVYFARSKVCTKDVKLINGSSSSSQNKNKKETLPHNVWFWLYSHQLIDWFANCKNFSLCEHQTLPKEED